MLLHELPIEILLNIIRAATIIPLEDGRGYIDCEEATRLASVCKQWHSIITETPDLWKEISSSLTTRALTTILECFNPFGPISIRSPPKCLPAPIHNFRIMARESHRLKEASFTLYEDDWKICSKRLCREAPLLESFSLYLEEFEPASDSDDDDSDLWDTCALPRGIFGGTKPPRLQYLCLSQVKVSWSSPLLHNLTALSLDVQDRPSQEQFVTVLRNMPLLESLQLSDCLPYTTSLESRYSIPLHKLRALRITEFAPLCEWFLNAVDMAPLCVEIDGIVGDLGMCVGMFRALADYLARVGREYLGMDIKVGPLGGVRADEGGIQDGFDLTVQVVTQTSTDAHPLSALDIHLSLACSVSDFEHALSTIVKTIHKPLRNIRFLALHVNSYVTLSHACWLDVFDVCFPKLRLLGLKTAEDMSAFFDLSLTTMTREFGVDGGEEMENFVPKRVPFKNVRDVAGFTFSVDDVVSAVLSLRRLAGYPLLSDPAFKSLFDISAIDDLE